MGRYEGSVELLLLCTDEGRVISLYPAQEVQRYGRGLSADDLLALKEMLNWSDRVKGYLLFAVAAAEGQSGFLDGFSNDMIRLMGIYERENVKKTFCSELWISWIILCAFTTGMRFSAMEILPTAM